MQRRATTATHAPAGWTAVRDAKPDARVIITAGPYRKTPPPTGRRYAAARLCTALRRPPLASLNHARCRIQPRVLRLPFTALSARAAPPIRETVDFSRCGTSLCVVKIRGAGHKFPVSRCRKTFRNTKCRK
jgi:hypothetical protein